MVTRIKIILAALFTMFAVISCEQELEEVNSRLDNLEQRVSALERIAEASKNGDVITSVTPITDGETITGYVITFQKGDPITVYCGKDGKNGEDGKDGDSIFQKITVSDTDVKFETSDGKTFVIQRLATLSITFDSDDLVVMGTNATRDIHYTVTSMIESIDIEIISSVNIRAKLKSDNATNKTGVITIQSGDAIDEYDKVVVIATDGNSVTMKRLEFEEEAIKVYDNQKQNVGYYYSQIALQFLSNTPCRVLIPEEAQEWISVLNGTKSLTKQAILIKIQKNTGAPREATVFVTNEDGSLKLPYFISQDGSLDYQRAHERDVLISIYNALDGINWEDNTNWCSDKPLNEWAGVGVEGEHVYQLNLHYRDGCIPKEIAALMYLRFLGLHIDTCSKENCGISEEIFSSLNNLESFGIDSSVPTKLSIPDAIYNCDKLRELVLRNIGIDGPISPKIRQLKNLESLHIFSPFFSGFPSEIGELSNLKHIWVHTPSNGGGDIGMIPNSIGKLKNLETLQLSNFSGPIPIEIGKLRNLKWLELYSEYDVTSVPEEIFDLTDLSILRLSFVNTPYTIPEKIGNLTNLESLEICYSLQGKIPESLGKLSKLKFISLANPFYFSKGEALTGKIPESVQGLDCWSYCWSHIIYGHPFLDVSDLKLPAPRFQVNDINGEHIDSDSIYSNNKLSIVYQYGSECSGARALHSILKPLYDKYSDKGLEIIGYGESEFAFKQIAKNEELSWKFFDAAKYPFANGGNTYLVARGHAIIIDSTGKIVYNNVTGNNSGLSKYITNYFEEEGYFGYESYDYSQDGKISVLQHASQGKGINIVILGDGFSDRQISSGDYQKTATQAMEAFFSEEPYHTYRNLFNVYSVVAVSKNEGANGETAFESSFGLGTSISGNERAIVQYALKTVERDDIDNTLIIVLVNENKYAGTCVMFSSSYGNYGMGLSIAYCPRISDSYTFSNVLLHETNHGFAKLADEYAYENTGAITNDAINNIKTQEPYGWWKNVDFTSDPAAVKWSQFLSDPRYANEGLGCYEGGLTYWTGVWRPTENSIMNTNTGGFNAPSRYAIWYRIGKLAYGESWEGSYEDFVAYDAVNRTPAAVQRRRAQAHRNMVEKPLPPLAPPVVVGHSWREELQKGK